jgi:hypothetical protein
MSDSSADITMTTRWVGLRGSIARVDFRETVVMSALVHNRMVAGDRMETLTYLASFLVIVGAGFFEIELEVAINKE